MCARNVESDDEDDARAVDRLDRAANLVGDGLRGGPDRDVADDPRSPDGMHVDGADRAARVADRVGEHAERARLVGHVDAQYDRQTDGRLRHVWGSPSSR